MFSMEKNNKRFRLSIPAQEKYIPLVRRYIIASLSTYGFSGGFLDQIEIIIDELSNKVSQSSAKRTVGVWLNIKFDIKSDGFSFSVLGQDEKKFDKYRQNTEKETPQNLIIEFPEIRLVERYSDSARLDLRGGSIVNVKMSRLTKEN